MMGCSGTFWVGQGLKECTDGLANWKINQYQRNYLSEGNSDCYHLLLAYDIPASHISTFIISLTH